MKKSFLVFSVGFALFSMFFGSGNLVFPLVVGVESGGEFVWSSLGIIFTGVVVPFLGVFGMILYNGDLKQFFSVLGKTGTFIFSLIALGLMGPFAVLARCFTVAHGSLSIVFTELPAIVTSLVFCLAIYILTVNKNKVVPILGSILTPILLVSVGAIAFFGFTKDPVAADIEAIQAASLGSWSALKNGFLQGYQTLDLLAAFFFSTFVIQHLRGKTTACDVQSKHTLSVFFRSALLGGAVLSCVYFVLVSLGSIYASHLTDCPPQEMLATIAAKTLGSFGAPCVCIAVVLACFTTAIVLASLFSDFLHKEVLREKVSHKVSLAVTLVIGLVVSSFGFSGITKYLAPLIEIIYPALIMLTVVNIAHKYWGMKNSHWPVTLTLAAKIGLLRFI